jgi:hypothetical protein
VVGGLRIEKAGGRQNQEQAGGRLMLQLELKGLCIALHGQLKYSNHRPKVQGA